jgi:hypothetical protein
MSQYAMEAGIPSSSSLVATVIDRRLTVLLFILPVGLLLLAALVINHGQMIYTLDDPYIHIDLARQIFSGHYGINPDEFSAPSSSVLWPLLLAPFTPLGNVQLWVPLILNLLFSWLTFSLLSQRLQELGFVHRLIILGGWLLATNFYGLIFNGMEHCLQVYLVVVIACGVLGKEYEQLEVSSHGLYAALLLLPLVRYEGMAVSLPVLLYLFYRGEYVRSLCCGALLIGLVGAFSLFLAHLGLGYLPSSVIAKSDTTGVASILRNLISQFDKYGWVILILLVTCGLLSRRKPLAVLLLTVTGLHLLFGKFGWFGRYEIYWLSFLGVFFLHVGLRHLSVRGVALIFGLLPVAFAQLVYTTLATPLAAAAIYNQQYPMAQVAHRLDAPVAVNDLGLVALNNRHYVLDLWGLGSLEALKLRKTEQGPGWIEALMTRKGVHYAMVYEEWFPQRPANWIKVGELKMTTPKIAAAGDTVAFYATDRASAGRLKSVMQAYEREVPLARFHFEYTDSAITP